MKGGKTNVILLIAGLGILLFLSNITTEYLNNIYEKSSPFYFNLCLQIIILLLGGFIIYYDANKNSDKLGKDLSTWLFLILFVYSFIQLFFYIILNKEFKDYWWISLPSIITIAIFFVRNMKKNVPTINISSNFQKKKIDDSPNYTKGTYLILTSSFILLLFESFLIRTKIQHFLTFAYCLCLVPIVFLLF